MTRGIVAVLATAFLLALLPLWTPVGDLARAEEKSKGTMKVSPQQLEGAQQMRAVPGAIGSGPNVSGSYDCSCVGGKGNQTECRTVRTADTLQCDKADTNACSGSCKLTVVITGGNVLAPQ